LLSQDEYVALQAEVTAQINAAVDFAEHPLTQTYLRSTMMWIRAC